MPDTLCRKKAFFICPHIVFSLVKYAGRGYNDNCHSAVGNGKRHFATVNVVLQR